LSFRFRLKAGTIDNRYLVALNADEPFRPESRQVPRDHLSYGAQSGRKLLVGQRKFECLRANSLGGLQEQSCQSLGDAPERHRLHQTDQVPQTVSHDGQDFQRHVRILSANGLEITHVDEERNDSVHRPHRCRIRPPSKSGNSATEDGAVSIASISSRPVGEVRKIFTLPWMIKKTPAHGSPSQKRGSSGANRLSTARWASTCTSASLRAAKSAI